VERCGDLAASVRLYDDFHVMIEGHKETHQALDGKLAELTAQHLADVGLFDSEGLGGLGLFHVAALHDGVDLEDELGLNQMFFGIGDAEVFKDVSASDFVSLLGHVSLCLAICSAWRSLR
jgi:hypothetical protein